MEINFTLFGAGAGLVLLGWIIGLVVSYAFSINRGIGRLGS
ncbi:hypothetical protein [Desulfogranum marinum]|nr:hypothetical protein [Desulfogranum marinum]